MPRLQEPKPATADKRKLLVFDTVLPSDSFRYMFTFSLLCSKLHIVPETLQCHPLPYFESLRAHSPPLPAGRNPQRDVYHYLKAGKRL